ncbi:MAG TPA: hypothetical protein VK589_07430 [Chryseolinea sp.]|nr:hypothetical protein [Chryseolinea sp.]
MATTTINAHYASTVVYNDAVPGNLSLTQDKKHSCTAYPGNITNLRYRNRNISAEGIDA